MPDAFAFLRAVLVTAALAGAGLLVCAWPWRAPGPRRLAVGWPAIVGVAVFAGICLFTRHPRWPLDEDIDRFLAIVFPCFILIECAAPFLPAWLAWPLCFLLALAAGRILLHGSAYLDPAHESAYLWSRNEMYLWLAGLAATLAVPWVSLSWLARHTSPRLLLVSLALICAGAGVANMLSGYATAGPPLFLFTAGLLAATGVSLAWTSSTGIRGAIAIALAGLFASVVSGHFFGSLTLPHALALLLAPLLAWLSVLPPARRLSPRLRGLLTVALVSIPVAWVVWQAQKKPESEVDEYREYLSRSSLDGHKRLGIAPAARRGEPTY
jgi:hypothetical protein